MTSMKQSSKFSRTDEQKSLELAVDFHKKGQFEKAKDLYREILRHNPNNADAMHRLGTIALQVENYEKAEEIIALAIETGPATPTMFINFGAALRNLEKYEAAIEAYDHAIALDPFSGDAHYNRGRALQDHEKLDDALEAYQRAIELNQNDAEAWVNLGGVYKYKGRLEDSFFAFEKALRIKPEISEAYRNTGSALIDMNLFEVALLLFEKALEINPGDVSTRYAMNNMLLQMGYLERGLEDINVRFEKFASARLNWKPEPPEYWSGQPFKDKRMILWCEQGIGEQILSMRILPQLLQSGCKCVVECEERLIPVFERSFPDVEVIRPSDHSGYVKEQKTPIDFQAPSLNMLIHNSGKTIDDIPAVNSYIRPDHDLQTQLRQKYERLADGRRIVGISWRSSSEKLETHKSADLEFWHPIINNPGVFVVNLQYGDYQEEVQQFENANKTTIYDDPEVDPLESIEQAIAQISAMDLVISISNSNVHMSGALGVPTWLMLPRNSGVLWFWFFGRTDSPFYSTVRIFRQPFASSIDVNHWPEVIDEVASALDDWLSNPLPPRPVP